MEKKQIRVDGIVPLPTFTVEDLDKLNKITIANYAVRLTNEWNNMREYYNSIIRVINGLDDCPYEIIQSSTIDEHNIYNYTAMRNLDLKKDE